MSYVLLDRIMRLNGGNMKFRDIKGCTSQSAQSTKLITIAFQRKLNRRGQAEIFVNGADVIHA